MGDITKIFGIGEPKTGTATLGVCFRTLFPHDKCASWVPAFSLFWNGNEIDFDKLFEKSQKYRCFNDFPWSHSDLYKKFDKAYPNSRFILTIRESEKWFDSFRRWYTNPSGTEDILWRLKKRHSVGVLSHPLSKEKVIENFENILQDHYKIKEVGRISLFKSEFINAYENRNAEIIEYFEERPNDLLIVNWENGDGWKELCDFLDVPIPNKRFPHINKNKKNK